MLNIIQICDFHDKLYQWRVILLTHDVALKLPQDNAEFKNKCKLFLRVYFYKIKYLTWFWSCGIIQIHVINNVYDCALYYIRIWTFNIMSNGNLHFWQCRWIWVQIALIKKQPVWNLEISKKEWIISYLPRSLSSNKMQFRKCLMGQWWELWNK